MLFEARQKIALSSARKLAGGPHKLVFDLYDRYKELSKPVEHHQKTHPARQAIEQSEQNIKGELALVFRDMKVRELFLGEFSGRLIKKVEQAQRVNRTEREQELFYAFAHYAILANWAQNVAQDDHITLTEDEEMLFLPCKIA
mgnify:CR=1 FL=1